MKPASTLRIRPMTREECGTLVSWAAAEGWNPGNADAEIFWQNDPEAFIAAEVDGRLVGGGAIVSYEGRYGFMGLFIVEPAMRGGGIGRQLWFARRDRLRARLHAGAAIEMDGVYAMEHFYAEGGFVEQHRDLRHEAPGWSTPPAGAVAATIELVPLCAVPFDELCAYDARCFPAPRDRFLRAWIAQPGATALGARRGGALVGCIVRRPCVRGHRIGPLFADDAAVAAALLDRVAAEVPGEPIQIDVPERNAPALALVRSRGMVEVFGCGHMTFGTPPAVDWNRIFGVTTLEVG